VTRAPLRDAIVLLGAGGGVGRGIAAELIAAGHAVIAVGRSQENLRELGASRNLIALKGSVATDAEAAKLLGDLNALRQRPIAVVATLCGGERASARLLEKPASFLVKAFEDDVAPHFIAAKHLLPMLAESSPGGLYLVVTGPGAQCPWAGYGHVSVTSAALSMLARVIREEAKDLPVRVQQLQIGSPVRTARNETCACPEWLSAADVGRAIVGLVDGKRSNEPVIQLGGYAKPAVASLS
jgi:NAD(P)-dependent dehydrogenase (short-subunit alcohol dehydrogenase family)